MRRIFVPAAYLNFLFHDSSNPDPSSPTKIDAMRERELRA